MSESLCLKHVLEALAGTPVAVAPGLLATLVTEVVVDSRQVVPGSLFVALPGERADGHDFVADAFERGAVAALVQRPVAAESTVWDLTEQRERFGASAQAETLPVCILVPNTLASLQQVAAYWRRQFSLRVVGITGSVGKSTSKELIWAVLRQAFNTLKNPGNLNNEIGLPLTMLKLTPAHERVVLEMGMYDLGEIHQLCEIARPQVGVITNVGPSHLERLKTIERIAQAKAELIESLPADGVAILNYDDLAVRQMAAIVPPGVQTFTYGLAPDADLWADQVVSEGLEGIRFVLHYAGESLHVKVPLLGRHSVHTALRATAVGLVENMTWNDIMTGLLDSSVQLRLVSVVGINGSVLLDDTYNASPTSTIAALNLLADLTGRKIAVLGDMAELGVYEVDGHRKVGCRAADIVDILVTVGSRSTIMAVEARACGMPAELVLQVDDNDQAISLLRQLLRPGDIVLVKGSRSMAMEEIVIGLQVPAGRQ